MKYYSLYKSFFDSRDFIQRYEFSQNKNGEPVIVITHGSNEKSVLEDNDENRLLLKEYDDKIKRQVNSVILNKEKILPENKIQHLTLKNIIIAISMILFCIASFDFKLYINNYSLYLLITSIFGSIMTVSFIAVLIPQVKYFWLKFNFSGKIEEDIYKNEIFLRIEKLLNNSMKYQENEVLNSVKQQNKQLISDYYNYNSLGIGSIDKLSLEEMKALENKVYKLKNEYDSVIYRNYFSEKGKEKNMIYKNRS